MTVSGAEHQARKIAVVSVGEEEFGIDILQVVEILKAQRICHLPQLPSFFTGVINVRGDVIPLVDLRLRFGLSAVAGKDRIVVVRLGPEKVGLLVDAVREVVNLEDGEVVKTPSMVKGLKAEYLSGLAKRGERIIILLNIDTVLTTEEKLQVREVAKHLKA